MKEISERKNIRLKNYDYSLPGYYYITICTQNRKCILSTIGAGLVSAQKIELKYPGIIIEKILLNLETEFSNIKIHEYVIMPNHIHLIIEICKRADTRPAPTIADIICSFKSRTTKLIIQGINEGKMKSFDKRFWQRNYYEHIIRNENEYLKIKQYIINNPYNWQDDEYF